jgi:hypothetical protein
MWLLPARERPESLRRFCRLYAETKASTPGVVMVDHDDTTDYASIPLPPGWTYYVAKNTCPADTFRHWMRDNFKDQKWVGFCTDDVIPITPEWDTALIGSLGGQVHVVSGNDRWMAPARMTPPHVYTGDVLRAVGYMFIPTLKYLFLDDMWENIGRQTGCWRIRMDVLFEHRNAMKHPELQDEIYHKINGYLAPDRIEFEKWKASPAFDEAVKAVKKLQRDLS